MLAYKQKEQADPVRLPFYSVYSDSIVMTEVGQFSSASFAVS